MLSISEKLRNHLKNGENWGKIESTIQGVHIVKIPKTKTREAMLYLEINPLKENGRPFKRKGVFINNQEMLFGFTEALSNEKSSILIRIIDQINNRESIDLKEYKEKISKRREYLIDGKENKTKKDEIDKVITSEKEIDKIKRLYVDIANILYMDHDGNDKLKVKNIPKLISTLKGLGYSPILIADSSIKHQMDDKKEYERMIVEKTVREAPAGKDADIDIIDHAMNEDCKFLTNNLYRDSFDKFDKDWIFSHRLTCTFADGEIVID